MPIDLGVIDDRRGSPMAPDKSLSSSSSAPPKREQRLDEHRPVLGSAVVAQSPFPLARGSLNQMIDLLSIK
jgi:hypothetical protein